MIATIENALADIAETLPEASIEMCHGSASGVVLAVSSVEMSGESITGEMPQERRRVIGKRIDFPDLAEGSLVELAGVPHLVTSLRSDPIGASLTAGLSEALTAARAAYSGKRRIDGVVMSINAPLDVLVVENAALPNVYGDAPAPNIAQSWTCCAAVESWTETTPPQTGDEMAFTLTRNGLSVDLRLRVSTVIRNHGWWIMTARPREV
jgi:hypothetical protein